ncbi:hypothetical protein [Arthrobacter sp. CAN_A1]|uniref:hypothetical protein n=1 Tax=Arthrobacter sp. CAN_A1 TaxID=2787717 RepID=UPI001A1D1F5B
MDRHGSAGALNGHGSCPHPTGREPEHSSLDAMRAVLTGLAAGDGVVGSRSLKPRR